MRTGDIPGILAGLADHSLLSAIAGPGATRYRLLETISQYGIDRLDEAGEREQALSRQLIWCLDQCAALEIASREAGGSWRAAFDLVADELRGALRWAAVHPAHQSETYRLAIGLADLTFVRGLPGESQRRYEQAAELAADDLAAADTLRSAADAAESRHFGNESLRLRLLAAQAALRGVIGPVRPVISRRTPSGSIVARA